MAKNRYTITGRLLDRLTLQGIEGLVVKAWDNRLIYKDVICGATTGYDLNFDVRHLWMRQKSIIGSHFADADSEGVEGKLSRYFVGLAMMSLIRETLRPYFEQSAASNPTSPRNISPGIVKTSMHTALNAIALKYLPIRRSPLKTASDSVYMATKSRQAASTSNTMPGATWGIKNTEGSSDRNRNRAASNAA